MRKAIKYIAWILVAILLLIIAALLFTQTAVFREKLKQKLVAEVNKQLMVKFEADKLNGNLYQSIEIEGVRLIENEDTVARFSSLKIEYRIVPLLSKQLLIDSIILNEPNILIKQEKDSSWNASNWIVKEQPADSEEKSTFNFKIEFDELQIKGGSAEINSLSNAIPKQLYDLNLKAEGSFETDRLQIDLEAFNLKTEEPGITINEISGRYLLADSEMFIDSLRIRTENSVVDASGDYVSISDMQTAIAAETISKDEIELFIPSLHLLCSPAVNADLKVEAGNLNGVVELTNQNQKIHADISIPKITALNNKHELTPYSLLLNFENVVVENWIKLEGIQAKLDGKVNVKGDDLRNPDLNTAVFADLKNSTFKSVSFNNLVVEGVWNKDSILATVDAKTDYGNIFAEGNVSQFSTVKDFNVQLQADNFNLSAYMPVIENTTLNAQVIANGQGFDPNKINLNGKLQLSQSLVYNYPVDSLSATFNYSDQNLKLANFLLQVPGILANGNGDLKVDSMHLLAKLNAKFDSLTILDSIVELPVAFDSAFTTASISGPLKDLEINGTVSIFNADAYGAKLATTKSDYNVRIHPDSLQVMLTAEANDIDYLNTTLDSTSVELTYEKDKLDILSNLILEDTIDVKAHTLINLGDTMTVIVPELEMKTFFSDYFSTDTFSVSINGNNKFEVSSLNLRDRQNADFELDVNGMFSSSDTSNLKISINDLNLSQLNRFMPDKDSVGGILDSELHVRGAANDPQINATVKVFEPNYGAYNISEIDAEFEYLNQIGHARISNPEFGENLLAEINLPFDLYLDSLNFVFSEPDSFSARLLLKDIDLGTYLMDIIEGDTLGGIMNVDLKANGEIDNPQLFGSVYLDKAIFMNQSKGIEYDNIQSSLTFEGNKVRLDTTYIRQKNGLFSINGAVEFDSTFIKGNIISSSLEANANNFFITKHRSYEILIDANTFIKTGNNKPVFGGKVKVLRSNIFLPALMPDRKSDVAAEVPLLVEALQKNDTLQVVQNNLSEKEKKDVGSKLIENLTGRLNVEIPKNTWIRSNDMRVEVSGDVEIVKTGAVFELFGDVTLERGHYILYGKKLNIKESQVTFMGGEEFDPVLNFQAEYVYRDSDREKRYLNLLVTGTMSEPDINFTLDDVSVTENDGISILLFGATADEIGYGDQNGVINSISSNAVASLITSQLSSTIGAQLNLDMIEITATESWKSAAFVVGKYITNDIFVIYERGFGEVEGDEITPETITVEYEINDKLFIRLQSGSSTTSGADIILKFEQERK